MAEPRPKVVYFTACTLDGFIADPDNSLQWLFDSAKDDVDDGGWDDFIAEIGPMAMGATTYQWILEHEDLIGSPEKWQQWYADRPAWVFTHRELPPIPGVDLRFVSGDVRPVYDEMVATATSGWSAAVTWSVSSTTPACSTRSSSACARSRWAPAPRSCRVGSCRHDCPSARSGTPASRCSWSST